MANTIKTYHLSNLPYTELNSLKSRPRIDFTSIFNVVNPIVDDVHNQGDAAVKQYTSRFDKVDLDKIVELVSGLPDPVLDPSIKEAFDVAYSNIYAFHAAPKSPEKSVKNMKGVQCKRVARSINSVGLYVPGGTAVLPSTALMLAVPAQIAGCKTIVLANPPTQDGSTCKEVLLCEEGWGDSHSQSWRSTGHICYGLGNRNLSKGCVLTGVWVVAHECGHHAFSDYQWLDDTVGLILHSALLVPYFSWKYSHRRHHSNTGSLEKDEVFVPKQKSSIYWYSKYLSNNPLGRILTITITLTLGWPLYLALNVSGRPYKGFACHFNPHGPIYSDRERLQIYVSDAAILAVCFGLYHLALAKGLAWVVCVYGVPLLVVNGFLVLITFLQHTHPALPHYDSSEWDWLRGALATVDRDYGILNKVFHNITDTHVAHHLFSTMPHYHAMEATKAIKPILGDYYRLDETPFYQALWREARECIYVEPDQGTEKKGVFWYNNKW